MQSQQYHDWKHIRIYPNFHSNNNAQVVIQSGSVVQQSGQKSQNSALVSFEFVSGGGAKHNVASRMLPVCSALGPPNSGGTP